MHKKYIIQEIKNIYSERKKEIQSRLDQFKKLWKNASEEEIFAELVFCLLTPQSKAKSCWCATEILVDKKLLLNCNSNSIAKVLQRKTRFHNKKAHYISLARKLFTVKGKISIKSSISEFKDMFVLRNWLVDNVKGMGYKEASHFLRNIGFGEKITILDRHILKNLKLMGVINKLPDSLTKNTYLEIEEKMKKFSKRINIPLDYLDFVLWCKETGEVFK